METFLPTSRILTPSPVPPWGSDRVESWWRGGVGDDGSRGPMYDRWVGVKEVSQERRFRRFPCKRPDEVSKSRVLTTDY